MMYDLPGYEFGEEQANSDGSITRMTTVNGGRPACCPKPACGCTKFQGNGRKKLTIRDLGFGDQRVHLQIKRAYFRCSSCDATVGQVLPGLAAGTLVTQRLADFLARRALGSSCAQVAEEADLDPKTVLKIFRRYAKTKVEELQIATPEVLGLDEIHLGSKRCAVAVNLEKDTIVAFLSDRKLKTLAAYFSDLKDKSNIKIVAIDPWETYRKLIRKYLNHCAIVVDKFHAVALAMQAHEALRKETLRGADDGNLTIPKFYNSIKPDRLDNREKDERDKLFKKFPRLEASFQACVRWHSIWNCQDASEVDGLIEEWIASLGDDTKKDLRNVIRLAQNWREEILAYFIHRKTNAGTESMNGKIRRIAAAVGSTTFEVLYGRVMLNLSVQKVQRVPKRSRRPAFTQPPGFTFSLSHSFHQPPDSPAEEVNLGADINLVLKEFGIDYPS